MTEGRTSNAPKLICLHIMHLLHNVEWSTIYRHYQSTRSLQMQPLQKCYPVQQKKINTSLSINI